MKIIIITDAWEPQINGVARTLQTTKKYLENFGHNVHIVHPGMFKNFSVPFTHDVKFAYYISDKFIESYLKETCAIHIATEGTLGIYWRNYCCRNGIPFTTSYHTNYPEYMKIYAGIPQNLTIQYLRWFNRPSSTIMVATNRLIDKLKKWNINLSTKIWSRGVDVDLFKIKDRVKNPEPIALYVGRVSKEKNIEKFLDCKVNFKKYVVGDGPLLSYLKNKYVDVVFTGALHGEKLVEAYNQADVFCFPSTTDTFGLVCLEALACGIPVAAFPVEGPADIIENNCGVGCLSENFSEAIVQAYEKGNKTACRNLALKYSWEKSSKQFFNNLVVYSPNKEDITPEKAVELTIQCTKIEYMSLAKEWIAYLWHNKNGKHGEYISGIGKTTFEAVINVHNKTK